MLPRRESTDEHLPAAFARLWLDCNVCIPASLGAIGDLVPPARGRKWLVAMAACVLATRSADSLCPGVRRKHSAAFGARFFLQAERYAALRDKLRIRFPKQVLRDSVALRAQRNEVRQAIGLPVVGEKIERPFVVDDQMGLRSAMLTRVAVPQAGLASLMCPVRTPVARMATTPCRVVLPCHMRAHPQVATGCGAQVSSANLSRSLLKCSAALKALDGNPLECEFARVRLLPKAVAALAAKVVLRLRRHVRLCTVSPFAVRAG